MASVTFTVTIMFATLVSTSLSVEICSSQRDVDSGRGQFWACVDGDCVTAYIRYPNISTNPSITLCQRQKSDGTECYSVTSQNICYDIPARTRLGVPDPGSNTFVWISTAFRQSPAKVCFQQPQEVCSSNGPVATLPSPSPSPPLIDNSPLRITAEERSAIVNQHNKFRKKTSPQAANMKKMRYSLTLANFVQTYLDNVSGCPLAHNPANTRYGESVYRSNVYGSTDNTVDYGHVITLWHDEEPWYDYSANRCNAPPNQSCGHYTQVVWGNTELVGCGVKQCRSGDWTTTLVLCNYNPPGNVRQAGQTTHRRPYKSGTKCTSCPSAYTICQGGLCVKPSDLALEQWYANIMLGSDREGIAEGFDFPMNEDEGDVGEWNTGIEEWSPDRDWEVEVQEDWEDESYKELEEEGDDWNARAMEFPPQVKVVEENAGSDFQPKYM